MVSQIGWVDFSSEDKERVKLVLSQLHEPGTLDELGIGAMRDQFSDLMFPGFSTIQTRAKYLITVPRIIRSYDNKDKSLETYLQAQENKVAEQLVKYHGEGTGVGIIGGDSIHSGGVQRRPSSVYWNAFRVWNIIETQKSVAQFCKDYEKKDTIERYNTGEEADDYDVSFRKNIVHLDTMILDDQWMEGLKLDLTYSESKFLMEKMRNGPSDSVPTQLFITGLLPELLQKTDQEFSTFAQWASAQLKINQNTRDHIRKAYEFSEAMLGAHIRFNCILAKKNNLTNRDKLENEWKEWLKNSEIQHYDVAAWFTHLDKIRPDTCNFIKIWCNRISDKASVNFLDRIVETRSRDNKKKRSLLNKQLPKDQGWVGMYRLNYRWPVARTILSDIQNGLKHA